MPISVVRHNPEDVALAVNAVLAELGFKSVAVRRTAAVACGAAALVFGYLALQEFKKVR